jgi:hypothetical protein
MPGPHVVLPAVETDVWTHRAAGEVSVGQPFGECRPGPARDRVHRSASMGAATGICATVRRARSPRPTGVFRDER